MSSHTAPISFRSLTKRFGPHLAVDRVTFDVPAGSVTGFIGANGAGKSTTMRMLLGLVAPSSGQALIDGRPYPGLGHPRREVGAVLDGPGAHPGLSARRHLSIVCRAAGIDRRRVGETLELVGLADDAHRRVGTYSLGMRQRLALASALLGDPPVLVLDEPVNGLDPPGILWMRRLLTDLAGEGRAVLVSSHLLSELAEVAHHVIVIDDGRLVATSTLTELLAGQSRVELRCADPALARLALHRRGIAAHPDGAWLVVEGVDAPTVGEIVTAAGAGPILGLAERTPTVEDAYFALAGGSPAATDDEAVAR